MKQLHFDTNKWHLRIQCLSTSFFIKKYQKHFNKFKANRKCYYFIYQLRRKHWKNILKLCRCIRWHEIRVHSAIFQHKLLDSQRFYYVTSIRQLFSSIFLLPHVIWFVLHPLIGQLLRCTTYLFTFVAYQSRLLLHSVRYISFICVHSVNYRGAHFIRMMTFFVFKSFSSRNV